MNASPPTAKSLFLDALKLDPDAWPRFLDEKCGADDALRAWVAGLLQAHREAASQGVDPAATLGYLTAPDADGPGAMIGPYRLLERVGEGGFGVVYVAEQTEPVRRKVALKVVKP